MKWMMATTVSLRLSVSVPTASASKPGICFPTKRKTKHGYESELTAYGADLVGEAPLSESFSVIVSIGLAKYTFKITQPNGWKYDQDVNGPRFGIGLQYEIIPHIALRTMFHYTSLNSGSTDFYDGVSEVSGGVRIIF